MDNVLDFDIVESEFKHLSLKSTFRQIPLGKI